MPSFNSIAQICNYALGHVGNATQITSMDEQSTSATVCNLVFDKERTGLLASHDWAFARKHVSLSEISSTQAPPVYWDYIYQKPADELRIIGLYDTAYKRSSDTRRIDYEVSLITVGTDDYSVIYTDLLSAYVIYTADITDTARLPQLVVDALAYRIAAAIAIPMTGDQAIARDMAQMAKIALAEAKAHDNSQGVDRTDWAPASHIEARA